MSVQGDEKLPDCRGQLFGDVGPLAGRITKLVPGVMLEFRPSGRLNILDLLDCGELD
jgi:hypothetical protein